MLLSLWLLLGLLPCVTAAPLEDSFPEILFVDFAKVIKTTFGADITLATVLMLLFSVTNNTDLLNLHGQQQAVPTNTQVVTSWMAAFVRAIKDRLQLDSLVADDDSDTEMDSDTGSGSDSDSGNRSDSKSGSESNASSSSDARSTTHSFFSLISMKIRLQSSRQPSWVKSLTSFVAPLISTRMRKGELCAASSFPFPLPLFDLSSSSLPLSCNALMLHVLAVL